MCELVLPFQLCELDLMGLYHQKQALLDRAVVFFRRLRWGLTIAGRSCEKMYRNLVPFGVHVLSSIRKVQLMFDRAKLNVK